MVSVVCGDNLLTMINHIMVRQECILWQCACRIIKADRIIVAIGKHIVAQNALACGGKCVGIDESSQFGIIITALKVVKAGLSIVDITAEAISGHFGNGFVLAPESFFLY